MGKGDKKTRKGKISSGTFGKSRPRKKSKDSENVESKSPDKKKAKK